MLMSTFQVLIEQERGGERERARELELDFQMSTFEVLIEQERGRERERARELELDLQMSTLQVSISTTHILHVCVCMYTHVYICWNCK